MEEVTSAASANNSVTKVTSELQDMYKVVSDKIRLAVSDHQLTPESFQTILVKVVETVEELSSQQVTQLSGTEKRAIAINLTRLVIDELHTNGQINDETYNWMTLGLTFLAPLIFQAAKSIWTKLQEVHEDIAEHGRAGCCARNFFSKKN